MRCARLGHGRGLTYGLIYRGALAGAFAHERGRGTHVAAAARRGAALGPAAGAEAATREAHGRSAHAVVQVEAAERRVGAVVGAAHEERPRARPTRRAASHAPKGTEIIPLKPICSLVGR